MTLMGKFCEGDVDDVGVIDDADDDDDGGGDDDVEKMVQKM